MASYSQTSLLQARNSLKLLLGMPSDSTFWTDAELDIYLRESLSTWATASLAYRERVNFASTANQPFYSLPSLTPELEFSSTDRSLTSQLEFELIEPQTTDWSLPWSGTSQFSYSLIQQAVQRARDQFLLETGMILTVNEIPTSSPSISRVDLPATTLDVRRVASKSIATAGSGGRGGSPAIPGSYKTLAKEDELTLNSYAPGWNIPQEGVQPSYYSIIAEPILQLQLAPIATDIYSIHLLLLLNGASLDLSTGVLLGVPEPFYWVIKYGALYELLGPHSQAHDPLRAKYCKLRWDEGIALAKLYPSILNAEINGQQVTTSTLTELDQFNHNWMNTTGTPIELAIASWNLIALSPIPDSDEISITLDIIKNPSLPSLDGDFLQVDQATLPIILDFARHLSMFKRGGAEFTLSHQGYDRMVQAASLQNSRLKAQAPFFSSLIGKIPKENIQRPFSSREEEAA